MNITQLREALELARDIDNLQDPELRDLMKQGFRLALAVPPQLHDPAPPKLRPPSPPKVREMFSTGRVGQVRNLVRLYGSRQQPVSVADLMSVAEPALQASLAKDMSRMAIAGALKRIQCEDSDSAGIHRKLYKYYVDEDAR